MKNSNNHKQAPLTTTFSIRVDKQMLDQIARIAEQKKWSRNQTIIHLLEQQCVIYQEQSK